MATFNCTYEELKRLAVEFLRAAETASIDELDNGLKCFNLHYLGCEYQCEAEEVMAVSLVKYVNKKYCEAEMRLLYCVGPTDAESAYG